MNYDAAGSKHSKVSPEETREYLMGAEFVDGEIEAIHHPEGRVVFIDGAVEYEYSIRDHLGNTRVSFIDFDDDGEINPQPGAGELVQENHYYPFGLNIQNPNYANSADPKNNYQYNGIEKLSDMNLQLLTAEFRSYDPSIGRWLQVHPLAEFAPDINPYRFGFNNPVLFNDPLGLFETKKEARRFRREMRRDAKKRGEKKGKYKIVKNGAGRYNVEQKNGDGVWTRTEGGDMVGMSSASSLYPTFQEHKPNFFGWINEQGLLGRMVYTTIDAPVTLLQDMFVLTPMHLDGTYMKPNEHAESLVNTAMLAVPFTKSLKPIKGALPEGTILLRRLNTAQFSSKFKGTAIARAKAKIRGRLNRAHNIVGDMVNNSINGGKPLISASRLAVPSADPGVSSDR